MMTLTVSQLHCIGLIFIHIFRKFPKVGVVLKAANKRKCAWFLCRKVWRAIHIVHDSRIPALRKQLPMPDVLGLWTCSQLTHQEHCAEIEGAWRSTSFPINIVWQVLILCNLITGSPPQGCVKIILGQIVTFILHRFCT